jgi:hypothetical protein
MKELLKIRNTQILSEYNRLSKIKSKKGTSKYTHCYILETLSNNFYLSEYTINRILTKI